MGYFEFMLGFLHRGDTDRPRGTAAGGKFRQHGERFFGRAAMIDEISECGGADIVGADQP